MVVDGVLLEGDCDGVLHAYDVPQHRRSSRRSCGRCNLGGCIESTPAVWKGRIYVGTRGRPLLCPRGSLSTVAASGGNQNRYRTFGSVPKQRLSDAWVGSSSSVRRLAMRRELSSMT